MQSLIHPTLTPAPMQHRTPDQGFPKGWYRVADSGEVEAGKLATLTCLDEELIAYRTAEGRAQVSDAYCPHLGAHLASHDGTIEEGRLICPFHKWNFDGASGQCVHIPYSDLPPSPVGLKLYDTREIDGMVLIWYHPEGKPAEFEPFTSDIGDDPGAWTLFTTMSGVSTAPFRDMLENLFDTAHIVQLHRSASVPEVTGVERTPYGMRVNYLTDPETTDVAMTSMEMHFTGISLLAQRFTGEAFDTRFLHSYTPIDRERFFKHSYLYVRETGSEEMTQAIGKAFAERFVFESEQDYRVLNFKKHIEQPRLCAGDGPINQFRKYAREFYVTG